jgi:hypothetical protein
MTPAKITPGLLALRLNRTLDSVIKDIDAGRLPEPQVLGGLVFWQEQMIVEFLALRTLPPDYGFF